VPYHFIIVLAMFTPSRLRRAGFTRAPAAGAQFTVSASNILLSGNILLSYDDLAIFMSEL